MHRKPAHATRNPRRKDRDASAIVAALTALTLDRVRRLPSADHALLATRADDYLRASNDVSRHSAAVAIDEILRRAEAEHRSADRVGRRIAEARTNAGLSQNQLARRCGLPQSYLSRIERGRHQAGLGVMLRIAAGLGISLAEFVPPPQHPANTGPLGRDTV